MALASASEERTDVMTEKCSWEDVLDVVDEYERKGWLNRFITADGREMWELTPCGRQALGLRPHHV
jgi:hypothetical protein